MMKTIIQELSKPTSERLALGSRWDWADSYRDGVERAMRENYAFMGGVQTVYLILGDKLSITIFPLLVSSFCLESKNQPCALTKMGQLLYYGKVVMAWKKNSPYGPLFNYLYYFSKTSKQLFHISLV